MSSILAILKPTDNQENHIGIGVGFCVGVGVGVDFCVGFGVDFCVGFGFSVGVAVAVTPFGVILGRRPGIQPLALALELHRGRLNDDLIFYRTHAKQHPQNSKKSEKNQRLQTCV